MVPQSIKVEINLSIVKFYIKVTSSVGYWVEDQPSDENLHTLYAKLMGNRTAV